MEIATSRTWLEEFGKSMWQQLKQSEGTSIDGMVILTQLWIEIILKKYSHTFSCDHLFQQNIESFQVKTLYLEHLVGGHLLLDTTTIFKA